MSKPRFKSVRSSSVWSTDGGDYIEVQPETRVHVWVFALPTEEEPAAYDPLDMTQWGFRVVPQRQLLACGRVSATLSFFDRLGVAPVPYGELAPAVAAARHGKAMMAWPPPARDDFLVDASNRHRPAALRASHSGISYRAGGTPERGTACETTSRGLGVSHGMRQSDACARGSGGDRLA